MIPSSCRSARGALSLGALVVLGACVDTSSTSSPTLIEPDDVNLSANAIEGAPAATAFTVIPNLPYATRSPSEALDIYLPATGTKPYPVVLFIHGGAWVSGSKKLPANAPQFALLNSGIALVSMNHRTSLEAKYPAQIQDAKAVIRWIRANAAKYSLDPNRIGAWGISSGGHLAALLGTTVGIPTLTDLTLGNPSQPENINAAVVMYAPDDFLKLDTQNRTNGCPPFGGTGFNAPSSPVSQLMGAAIQTIPQKVATASPLTYVNTGDATFLIQHGTKDCTIPWQQSGSLASRVTALLGASKVTLTYFSGAIHGDPIFMSPANVTTVVSFFKTKL